MMRNFVDVHIYNMNAVRTQREAEEVKTLIVLHRLPSRMVASCRHMEWEKDDIPNCSDSISITLSPKLITHPLLH